MGANVPTRSGFSSYSGRLVAKTLTQTAVAPKGVIEFANHAAGRYALHTSSGYTIFQLPAQGVVLAIDDTVTGDLEALAAQSYRIGGVGDVNVFVEKACLTRSAAEAWLGA
jgi:hypothetical protein